VKNKPRAAGANMIPLDDLLDAVGVRDDRGRPAGARAAERAFEKAFEL
jgi:hypothetical protein